MSAGLLRLLALEMPFRERHATLRLLEPAGSCHDSLWERLFSGTYDKPFIIEHGLQRYLHFDLNAVQSAMHLGRPDRLSLAYTRNMMAFLLFNGAPARILLLGLGGGSLAKFCYRRLPRATLTAVEVNSDVIALRDAFCVPPDDERFRVVRADGADYVARLAQAKDVILADACDRVGVAPELDTIEFYRHAYRRLRRGGVFVTNLCSDVNGCAAHMEKIRAVFGSELLTLRVRRDGNTIVFAFKERHPPLDWERLAFTAAGLERNFGLDFPRYVRRIAREWRLRRGQPALRRGGLEDG
jgi:spermidine synthase